MRLFFPRDINDREVVLPFVGLFLAVFLLALTLVWPMLLVLLVGAALSLSGWMAAIVIVVGLVVQACWLRWGWQRSCG